MESSEQNQPPASGAAKASAKNTLDDLVTDLKTLRYDELFPIRQWIAERPWDLPWVRAVLFFALYPLVVITWGGNNLDLGSATWMFGLYFSLLWGGVLFWIVRPGELDIRRVVGVAAFTAFFSGLMVLTVRAIPPFSIAAALTGSLSLATRVVAHFIAAGVLEETAKAVPVLWLVFKVRSVRTPREAAFLAGISGLAFGVAEGIEYSFIYLGQLLRDSLILRSAVTPGGQYLTIEFVRIVSLPFLHCVWSTIAGYYVGLAGAHRQRASALIVVGVISAAVLHTLHNALSVDGFLGWLGLTVDAAGILVFICYARSADRVSETISAQETPLERFIEARRTVNPHLSESASEKHPNLADTELRNAERIPAVAVPPPARSSETSPAFQAGAPVPMGIATWTTQIRPRKDTIFPVKVANVNGHQIQIVVDRQSNEMVIHDGNLVSRVPVSSQTRHAFTVVEDCQRVTYRLGTGLRWHRLSGWAELTRNGTVVCTDR